MWDSRPCMPFYGPSLVLVYRETRLNDTDREYQLIKAAREYTLCKEYPLHIKYSEMPRMGMMKQAHEQSLRRRIFCYLERDSDDRDVIGYSLRDDGSLVPRRLSPQDDGYTRTMSSPFEVLSCDMQGDTDLVCRLYSSLATYNAGSAALQDTLLLEGVCNVPSQRLAIRAGMLCNTVSFEAWISMFRGSCIDKVVSHALLVVKRDDPDVLTQRWRECTIGRVGMEPLHPWEMDAGSGAMRVRDVLDDSFCAGLDAASLPVDIIESCGPPTGRPVVHKKRHCEESREEMLQGSSAVRKFLRSVQGHRS